MAAISSVCFLCESDVSEGTSKSKRRRLLGESAKKAVSILDELSTSSYGRKFSECVDENLVTYVCHKCCKQIESLPGLLEKAYSERGNILKMMQKHLSAPTCTRRKRRHEDDHSEVNSPKRLALEEGDTIASTHTTPSKATGVTRSRRSISKDIDVSVS